MFIPKDFLQLRWDLNRAVTSSKSSVASENNVDNTRYGDEEGSQIFVATKENPRGIYKLFNGRYNYDITLPQWYSSKINVKGAFTVATSADTHNPFVNVPPKMTINFTFGYIRIKADGSDEYINPNKVIVNGKEKQMGVFNVIKLVNVINSNETWTGSNNGDNNKITFNDVPEGEVDLLLERSRYAEMNKAELEVFNIDIRGSTSNPIFNYPKNLNIKPKFNGWPLEELGLNDDAQIVFKVPTGLGG